MSYSQFTIDKVKQDFRLTIVEGIRFFPDSIAPVTPSSRLQGILEDLPWAISWVQLALRERSRYRESAFGSHYQSYASRSAAHFQSRN